MSKDIGFYTTGETGAAGARDALRVQAVSVPGGHGAAARNRVSIWSYPAVFLCAVACYPYAYYRAIQNGSDRLNVLARGFVVIMSPTVGLLSLLGFGGAVLSSKPMLLFLPVVAAVIDRLAVAMCWQHARAGWALWAMRIGLALISAVIALYSGVGSEQKNLEFRLREHEREQALRDPEIAQRHALLGEQITQLQQQLNENGKREAARAGLVRERALKLKLADKEAHGDAGIDAETSVVIRGGGKCGSRCRTHQADARALGEQIAELDRLESVNRALAQRIAAAELQREALISARRSDTASTGSLIRALGYADAGVLLEVCALVLIIVFLEMVAIILAHIQPSENLLLGKQLETEEDRLRSLNESKLRRAAIHVEQSHARKVFGMNHAPVIVEVTAPRAPEFGRPVATEV